MLDDELNILPISSHAAAITPVSKGVPADGDEAEAAEGRPAAGSAGSDSPELRELKRTMDTKGFQMNGKILRPQHSDAEAWAAANPQRMANNGAMMAGYHRRFCREEEKPG